MAHEPQSRQERVKGGTIGLPPRTQETERVKGGTIGQPPRTP